MLAWHRHDIDRLLVYRPLARCGPEDTKWTGARISRSCAWYIAQAKHALVFHKTVSFERRQAYIERSVFASEHRQLKHRAAAAEVQLQRLELVKSCFVHGIEQTTHKAAAAGRPAFWVPLSPWATHRKMKRTMKELYTTTMCAPERCRPASAVCLSCRLACLPASQAPCEGAEAPAEP